MHRSLAPRVVLGLLLIALLSGGSLPGQATAAALDLNRSAGITGAAQIRSLPDAGAALRPLVEGREATQPASPQAPPADWWTAVQKDVRQSEYHVTWQDQTTLSEWVSFSGEPGAGAYQAPNRAHNLRTYFGPQGISIVPRAGTPAWELSLALTGYGYAGDLQPVDATEPTVAANRVTYQRPLSGPGEGLTEWYVNDASGLKQGFTLTAAPIPLTAAPPAQASYPLVLELALAGDLIPTWDARDDAIAFTTAAGEPILRYGDLTVTDAAGRELPAHLSLSPSHIYIRVDDTAAVYPVTVAPTITGLSRTASWQGAGDQADAEFGWSVSTAGDVNGDGYADVIVGAQWYDHGQDNEGRAFVYHGSATGLGSTAAWTAEGDQAGAEFGYSVGSAGDVNGDGYADIIVGARWYDGDEDNEGRAFVYHGSATGLSVTANWTAEGDQVEAQFGYVVGTAGDVNGDGYTDVVVTAIHYDSVAAAVLADVGRVFVYHGHPTGLGATPTWTAESDQAGALLGYSASTAGDVNGDGYGDLIVGASGYNITETVDITTTAVLTDVGAAYVYFGSSTGLTPGAADWTVEGDQEYASLGNSVGTAGDVNGDGYTEIVIGASLYDVPGVPLRTDAGRAWIYYGSAIGPGETADWTTESEQPGAQFGHVVGAAGDVNGDGYADVVLGAHRYDHGSQDEGGVFVYHGGSTGLSTAPDWTAESNQPGAQFGFSVGTAGDVNGDGYADVIVGANRFDVPNGTDLVDAGQAFVYHGSATGLRTGAADWSTEGDHEYVNLGIAVGTAGDVNGDGYADVIVGAHHYDNGQEQEGRASAYLGSPTGLSTSADWTIEGNQVRAHLGVSVGTAGDVNGDGYADVIVGANDYDDDQTDEGRVYVFHGSAAGLSTTPAWMAEGDQAEADFGYAAGTAGDVNGDGYADVIVGARFYDNGQIDEGQARVYLGSATGLRPGAAHWTIESDQPYANLGTAVGTAGDVNGDGFSDVIVGADRYDHGQNDEGRALVYHGGPNGLTSGVVDWTAESNQAGAHLGTAVGTAGDVNGDGYADVIVGADQYSHDEDREGWAFVHHGGPEGLKTGGFNWAAESNQEGARFGWAVGTAGDVNGDGYADVIIGAYFFSNGQANEGRAFVYHGGPEGLDAAHVDWTGESDQNGTEFGYAVGTAGDVNGDGYADVIVGAPYYDRDTETRNVGRAYVYYGNGGAGLSLTPRQLQVDGSTPIAPLGMVGQDLAVQLSLIGRTPLGRADVKLQWQIAPLGHPFTATTVIGGSSANWIDTQTSGVLIRQDVTGLSPGTAYHWRARLLYRPGNWMGQAASRWVHIPWNGWAEQDWRTIPGVGFGASSYRVSESAGAATIGVSLGTPAGRTVTVDYATSDGTAVAGSDYIDARGTLTFTPGVINQTFDVPLIDDALEEGHKTVVLTLSNPGGAVIRSTNPVTLTILDDEQRPSLSITDASVMEGNSGTVNAVFTVTLSWESSQPASVVYATADDSATAPEDYVAIPPTTLTFESGTTIQPVTVFVHGDTVVEPDETFWVNLSDADNASLADARGRGTILDDDVQLSLYLPLILRHYP
jgi:hypothetical protein